MKRYISWIRISSEEQKAGWSIGYQDDAANEWAAKNDGAIFQRFAVTETAHKTEHRKRFHEMIAFVKANIDKIDGILFFRIDRAVRNLADWVKLEDLRNKHGLQLISISEGFADSPSGRLGEGLQVVISRYYSDELAEKTRKGIEKRVQSGLFPNHAPYGYQNYREAGKGLIRLHPRESKVVCELFRLYTTEMHTIATLRDALYNAGYYYKPGRPKIPRQTLWEILQDKSYIGQVYHRGHWFPGKQQPLITPGQYDLAQQKLGVRKCLSHQSLYGHGLITCGHCGRPLVCEVKQKKNVSGMAEYRYYRCGGYNDPGHPRIRLTEKQLDRQVLDHLKQLKWDDEKLVNWMRIRLKSRLERQRQDSAQDSRRMQSEKDRLKLQKSRLLDLRLDGAISQDDYYAKESELRQRIDLLADQIDLADQRESEFHKDLLDTFELSQSLEAKWFTSNSDGKRNLMQILGLNWTLNNATLCATMRSCFHALANIPPEIKMVPTTRHHLNRIAAFARETKLLPNEIRLLIRQAA